MINSQPQIQSQMQPQHDPIDSLSPEYKEKWQILLKEHPWIIKEDSSL